MREWMGYEGMKGRTERGGKKKRGKGETRLRNGRNERVLNGTEGRERVGKGRNNVILFVASQTLNRGLLKLPA